MCGRYYIEISDQDLSEIVKNVQTNLADSAGKIDYKLDGEIFPTDIVPVQTADGVKLMKWGFSSPYDKRPIINARSETAESGKMFSRPMRESRCLIPASGYFEWQGERGKKTKYKFHLPDQPIFLAGCFRQEKDLPVESFVILTRDAVGDLLTIHHRMPVIIPRSLCGTWLHDTAAVMGDAVSDLVYEPA